MKMNEKEMIYNLLMQEDKRRGGDLIKRHIKVAGLKAKRDAALNAEKDDDNVGISFPRSAEIERALERENIALSREDEDKQEIAKSIDWYVRTFMQDAPK